MPARGLVDIKVNIEHGIVGRNVVDQDNISVSCELGVDLMVENLAISNRLI